MITLSNTHPKIGYCIYCGAIDNLTDEHVIPYGLGGKELLKKASCKECAKITCGLEQRLLRGQWWPYRKILNIRSRSGEYPKYQLVKLKFTWGETIEAKVLLEEVPIVVVLEFDPPSILEGKLRNDVPIAIGMGAKFVANMPNRVLIDGRMRFLQSNEQIEFPTTFVASDLVRFLAKIAHCYAIYSRGVNACTEYFLPKYILGNGDGALSYVGNSNSKTLDKVLPGNNLHSMLDVRNGDYLSVFVQLFRDGGDPPPIYEVIVGKLSS